MASGLESMERERAMVLAGISHDLRTPLSRLRLALEMSGAERRRGARRCSADIEEMDAIIGQFLDFARGEDEEKAEHDLRGVLDELAEHYARLGKKVAVRAQRLPAPSASRAWRCRRAIAQPDRQRPALCRRADRGR